MRKERMKFLIQGILLLLLGFLFMSNPIRQGSLFLMIIGIALTLIGIVIIIDGIVLTQGFKYKLFRIAEGILFSGFGIVFFLRNPARGAALMIYFVVIMMIVLAVVNTIAVFKLDHTIKWLAIALNVLVIWFGFQSLLDPQLAVAIFYWTVSFQLIFTGINHILMYFLLPDLSSV